MFAVSSRCWRPDSRFASKPIVKNSMRNSAPSTRPEPSLSNCGSTASDSLSVSLEKGKALFHCSRNMAASMPWPWNAPSWSRSRSRLCISADRVIFRRAVVRGELSVPLVVSDAADPDPASDAKSISALLCTLARTIPHGLPAAARAKGERSESGRGQR